MKPKQQEKATEGFLIVGTAAGRHRVINVPPGPIRKIPPPLIQLILPFFNQSIPRKFEKVLLQILRERKNVSDFVCEFGRDNRAKRFVLLNSEAFFESTNARPLIVINVQDITHLHEAEAARENRLRELDRLTHELEKRVDARTRELRAANDKLHTLSARMLEAQEMERRHLARELHDEIGQQITCLQILTENQLAAAPPELKRALKETRRATAELLATVRQLSADLRPQLLDDFGLVAALEWHFARFKKRTGIEVRLDKKNFHDELLNSFLRNILFRVAQEALTNVARHARSNFANVELITRKGFCRLVVRDEGKGFRPNSALRKGSFGLSGMQERVFLAGGKLEINSAPGKGANVIVEVPLISVQTNAFEQELTEPS